MFRLEQIERNQVTASPNFLTATSPKLESLLPELFNGADKMVEAPPVRLNAEALGIPRATVEGQALTLTARFCDSIFNDPTLPIALKDAVAKLQIRIAKLAVRDRNLFQQPAHPCRLLIERIATLLLGLPDNVPATHPLCRQVGELGTRLRQDPAGDLAAFANAAQDMLGLIDARRRALIDAASIYLPMLGQLDQREQADLDIDAFYATLPVDSLPAVLQEFVGTEWKRLLEDAWFCSGKSGQAWLALADTLTTLLWSFQPKSDIEQRRELAQKVPGVIKAVKDGIEKLGIPAERQTAILDACFDLQTRALRPARSDTQILPEPVPPSWLPEPRSEPRIEIRCLETGPLVLQSIDLTGTPTGDGKFPVFPPGEWMELLLDETPHALCLCRQSEVSGRCLFFNPETGLALAVHPRLLEEQLASGGARRLEPPPLFDTILARINTA